MTATSSGPRRLLRGTCVFLVLLVLWAGFVVIRLFLFQPNVEIGPKTTRVAGPLRPDGGIDFAGAMHEEWSQGITPENNAAVVLSQVLRPIAAPAQSPEIEAIVAEFYHLLECEPPKDESERLVTLDAFIRDGVTKERAEELKEIAGNYFEPDLARRYPELAAWVQISASPLEVVAEGARRKRFYAPMVPPPSSGLLMSAPLDLLLQCQEAARLLGIRSQLRLASGDVEGACEDVLTCHRLCRLVSQAPCLVGQKISRTINGIATRSGEAIVLSGKLTPELAKRVRQEQESLPEFGDVAAIVDRGERLIMLDAMARMTQSSPDQPESPAWSNPFAIENALDPNVILRDANDLFDRVVAVLRQTDLAEQSKGMSAITQEIKNAVRKTPSPDRTLLAAVLCNRTALTEPISKHLVSMVFPSFAGAQTGEHLSETHKRLGQVGWALAEYRADHGEFPETLDALKPGILSELPTDFYTGEPLHYQRVEGGFTLYSVGGNRKDDNGVHVDPEGNIADDVAFGIKPAYDEESLLKRPGLLALPEEP